MVRPTTAPTRHLLTRLATGLLVTAVCLALTPAAAHADTGKPATTGPPIGPPITPARPTTSRGVLTTPADLATRPTTGADWNTLTAAAQDRSGAVNLADQDSTKAARTLAAALLYARTGNTAQRTQVTATLAQLPSSPLRTARVLSVARQLGGYALAADLTGYRDPAFTTWLAGMRTRSIGNHGRWTTLTGTSENSGNNWGAWALATRIAIDAYLHDTTDLARAATVFRGFLGDRSAYAGFRHTADYDPTWGCGETGWAPINPTTCGAKSGAIVEDISRSAGHYPKADDTGRTYSWEVLGGATLSARLLQQAGYRDVWQWSDRALLRAATFLHTVGGYPARFRVNQYIPHEINGAYGVNLGPTSATAGFGRQFGFVGWLGPCRPTPRTPVQP
jgi:hypothetical protein